MPEITIGNAVEAYHKDVERRDAETTQRLTLALGNLGADAQTLVNNTKLPAPVRLERVSAARSALAGRSSRGSDENPAPQANDQDTPRNNVNNDGPVTLDTAAQRFAEALEASGYPLSTGQVAGVRRLITRDPNVRIEVDRTGTPVQLEELRQENRQLEDDKAVLTRQLATANAEISRLHDLLAAQQTPAPAPQGGNPTPPPATDNPDDTKTDTPSVPSDPQASASGKQNRPSWGQRVRNLATGGE